ncbi:MAG TPA: SprT family zinc-dependent metalloprotease [bacterium]|nr:SprT family zinc-dependent metalloprotease [bacterium]HPJ72060.1 SprT family zinc-dependent metalloprotease [bacterium]HPQ66827.1 SprT family zinc-dependent metalloprotease [bacterium]
MKVREEGTLVHDGRRIPYLVRRSSGRNLRIEIMPEGAVKVFVPRRASFRWAAAVVRERGPWIARKLAEQEARTPVPDPSGAGFGDEVFYLGRRYRLAAGEGPEAGPFGSRLKVSPGGPAGAGARLEAWQRVRARELFPPVLAEMTRRLGLDPAGRPELRIRNMRRRWGSCTVDGRIAVNLRLIQLPPFCFEYVIAHEACHLVHLHHGPGFYALLERLQPDWPARRDRLDGFRLV